MQTPYSHPFFVRITPIRHLENRYQPSTSTAHDHHWMPPEQPEYFQRGESSGWWVWDPGSLTPENGLRRLRRPSSHESKHFHPYRACSMFWDHERGGYVNVPFDCTEISVRQSGHVWRRLMFGRSQSAGAEHVACIGHSMSDFTLPYPGPAHWFEKLLPRVCQSSRTGPRYCALAGDLSMLVCLLAFSARPQHVLLAVDRSFRDNVATTEFRPHSLPGIDRTQKRGVLVEIGVDSSMPGAHQSLQAWESGQLGEIFS